MVESKRLNDSTYALHKINDTLRLRVALVVKVGSVEEFDNLLDISILLLIPGIFLC